LPPHDEDGRIEMKSTKQIDGSPVVRTIDPNKVRISEYNERAAATNASDGRTSFDISTELKESVRQTGLIEPPLVRRSDDPEFDYEIVVGARRVRAVQHLIADGDLSDDYTIDALIMDWNDFESLRASITENIEAFRKDVSRSLRCEATIQLWEMAKSDARNQNKDEPEYADFIVETIGVSRSTASLWFERADRPWPKTSNPVEVEPVFSVPQSKQNRPSAAPTPAIRSLKHKTARDVDKEDAAKQVAELDAGNVAEPSKSFTSNNSTTRKSDGAEQFVLPPRYDFLSDTKLRHLRLMVQQYTDDPSEQEAWARRCLDKLENFHSDSSDTEKPHITFEFTEPDFREAKRMFARRDMTPIEAIEWIWNKKIESITEAEYGSARVLFSARGETKVRLQFLAVIKRTTQEEIGRTALTQYLINSRELAEIDLSIGEMNDLLESHKKVPSEIADLYEEGQL